MLAERAAPETGSLLDRARGGDAEAFGELCRAHEPRLLRQAMSLCRNASSAEDLAQDTLVEAWKCLHRYDGQCRFFTWLCAILLNRHRRAFRSRWLWRFRPAPAPGGEAEGDPAERLADGGPWPDQAVLERERSETIRNCVQALPRKHREVIHLRFYADDSLEGIAAALGCSVGTVKSRLFHALERLRRMKGLRPERTPVAPNPSMP